MCAVANPHLWTVGPIKPVSDASFVHIWRIPLKNPPNLLIRMEKLLSGDELDRANRFRFSIHRDQFVSAHACLRDILARYLQVSPTSVVFSYSPYGKPSLAEEFSESRLSFNLSHSQELGLVAITDYPAVGVDIEFMRPDLEDEQVARRFFSEREVSMLLNLPAEQRREAFFNCWTRKEAYIKARGEGLSMPLDQFDVSINPGEPAELIETRPDPAQALQWKLYAIQPEAGYAAALAVEGEPATLCYWFWDEQPAG